MFRIPWRKRRRFTVTAVLDDPFTLESLGRYLDRRVSFRAVPRLDGAFAITAASDAIVFYPDPFSPRSVQLFLRRLIGNSTLVSVVVVTEHPERFEPLTRSRSTANKFIVFSKPAWPWDIFAALTAGTPGLRFDANEPC